MTKEAIKERLSDILGMSEQDDPIGYLEYDMQAMELYIRKKSDNNRFKITKLQRPGSRPIYPKLSDDLATIYYPSNQDHFGRRVGIAMGLGMVASKILPDNPFCDETGFTADIMRIIYFTQIMLQKRADLFKDDACARDGYAKLAYEVPLELHKMFPHHDPSKLSKEIQHQIDGLLEEIHLEMPDKGFLDHDTRLVSSYIANRENIEFQISRLQSDTLPCHKANMFCYKKGCNVRYSKENSSLEKRVLIGHELGNIACHWAPGRLGNWEDETLVERKEATYFSKILLESRAERYLGRHDESPYEKECQKVARAIEKVYFGQDQSWLDWVLKD